MTRQDLDAILRHAVILGTLAVLLIPAARGSNAWFGWLPLWLVGMPLAAWWALHRFQLPQATATVLARGMRRLRPHRQARRRRPSAAPGLRRRAA